MNATVRRIARAIAPAPVRRHVRLLPAKRRIVATYGGIRRSPRLALRYLLFDHELDNFTYRIANTAELADFLADVLETDAATVRRYIDELAGDRELAGALGARLADRPDRNRSMPFGRRLGWYAIVRARRPQLVVETGVHDGLGSTALLRALQRNRAEGFAGDLVSFDIRPGVGWLIPDWLRDHHRLVIGDSNTTLPATLGYQRIDMFIHDSDHRYAHESAEFESIAHRASPRAVFLTDNAHASSAFSDFCDRRGLMFRYWGEVPREHFYPGAGIGMTVAGPEGIPAERSKAATTPGDV